MGEGKGAGEGEGEDEGKGEGEGVREGKSVWGCPRLAHLFKRQAGRDDVDGVRPRRHIRAARPPRRAHGISASASVRSLPHARANGRPRTC